MKHLKNIQIFILLSLPIFFFSASSKAQDNHYWAQQYGASSTLMGGAMIGGVSDNSAVFYNPAALAFIDNPSLSIDANVYKMDKIFIQDGAGQGINLNSAQISVYPQIISGMVNLVKNDKLKISYTMLTRNHNNILMNTRYTSSDLDNSGNPDPSATSFVRTFDYTNQLIEQWFGIGAGYKVTEKLAAGVTLFGCYRGQTYALTNYLREIKYSDPNYIYVTTTNDEAIKYNTFRSLAKFGFSYISGRFKYGLTLTTPSVGHYGKGDIQRENSNIVVSENPADLTGNFIISDKKTGNDSKYKHPLSIGCGIDYQTAKTRLAVSAEYFFKIDPYNQLEPVAEPFIYPVSYLDSADIKPLIDSYLNVEDAAKAVFNIAIGFSQVIYRQFSLVLGASTDFSCYEPLAQTNELLHGFSGSDIYHFSTGISYHKQKHTLSLGYTYGYRQSQEIPSNAMMNPDQDLNNDARLSAQTYSIVFGYTYYFVKYSE